MISTRPLFFSVFALHILFFPAVAHRLDEYLQATTISLARDHILVHLRLTPGVDVAEGIIRQIDQNSDGILSAPEQKAYELRVLRALSLCIDGHAGHLLVENAVFPAISALKAGTGVIDLQIGMKTRLQNGTYRLTYHNQGTSHETAWLVNCLMPRDPALHVTR